MSFSGSGSQSVESILDERVVISEGLVFVSGLSAADPLVGIPEQAAVSSEYPYYGADIQKQTTYLLDKLSRLLEAHDSGLDHVVKTQVFLTDCRLFDAFDQVWKRFFPVPPPRTTVGVGTQMMPVPGTLVAVDIIAALPEVVEIRQVDSPRLPKPLANYTPCVAAGDWLFLAGQLPTEFGATGLASAASVNSAFPHHVSPLAAQTEFTIGICETLLEDAGSDWDHTQRVHVFLKDMTQAPLFHALWSQRFDGTPPPCLVIGVEELLTGGAQIEIDVIALKSKPAATSVTVYQAAPAADGYRPFAVEKTVRQAFDRVGAGGEPVKVHAFLPHPTDIYAFGRGLPAGVAESAAITTSPTVGGSEICLEIISNSGGASIA